MLREIRGLSQTDLARQVGCSQATISRIEKGQSRQLSDTTRLRIARVLNADPHRLFPYQAQNGDVA